ncbi:hypothetical protein Daesc_001895 [Daldinia eschscholtzii]|uniref:Uncharacterized protein n=1 Tax=Daldinia eschscholtzii TaxID=292717 RepID=A0AAX6MVR6_9PEZI
MANQNSSMPSLGQLIVGTRDQVILVHFDGTQFAIASRFILPDWMPCSILFKEPDILYAVNKLGSDTNVLRLVHSTPGDSLPLQPDGTRPRFDEISFVANGMGSFGGRHLAFNADKTRMVETCHETGEIDIWDISAGNNVPRLMKTLQGADQTDPRKTYYPVPSQTILDPTGRYFIIANPGNNSLAIIDTKNDRYEIAGIVVIPEKISPGAIACITSGGTHYLIIVGQINTAIALVRMEYTDKLLKFTTVQTGQARKMEDGGQHTTMPFAGLVVASNQRDIYIWNRFSNDRSGHIGHFTLDQDAERRAHIRFVENIPTGGIQPRMLSLSSDDNQEFAIVANETGDAGIAAFRRDPTTGRLDPNPVATIPNHLLVAWGVPENEIRGPQFVREL